MKRLFLTVLLVAAGLPAALATDAYWINSGVITTAPQIDASNFVNNAGATLSISTINPFEPFETSNTENYTNKGTLTSAIGWKFDTAPSGNGVPRMASSFRNYPSASVTAVDGGVVGVIGPGNVVEAPSKLFVNATNVFSDGFLTVGSQGFMSLNAKHMNLTRGGLQSLPNTGRSGTIIIVGTNQFIPDLGITDNYWGVGTNNNVNITGILTGSGGFYTANSPQHNVQYPGGLGARVSVLVSPANSFVFTNAADPVSLTLTNENGDPTNTLVVTNYTVQAAFVGISDPNINLSATFFPSSNTTNLFRTVTVGMSTLVPNPVTGGSDLQSLYLMDQLASETNSGLSLNLSASPSTYRPAAYTLQRQPTLEYLAGNPPNSAIRPNLIYDPMTMSNRNVTVGYAGYSATASALSIQQVNLPGGSITNAPGRIEISADTLDLTRTRMRADGLVTLKTPHLLSSSNAVVDAQNLYLDLGSTNGTLRVQNITLASVQRFQGTIACWSGVWTNSMSIELTNFTAVATNMPDPNDPTGTNTISTTNYVFSPVTNNVSLGFHVLILDATALGTSATPVTTYNFFARSTNVLLDDPVSVDNAFFTDAKQFTIEGPNGAINLGATGPIIPGTIITGGTLQDWTAALAPNLLYFTNSGTLSVPNEAHFGDDRSVPYAAFVNKANATGFAAGIHIRSQYFENSGYINSGSLLSIQTVSGKMENAQTVVGGDLRIQAQDFRLRNYTNQSFGTLEFTITNSLADSGPGAQVRMVSYDGFHFTCATPTGKPQLGDLLGTTLESIIPQFTSIPHTWPGDDRGPSAAGFTNNLALGRLNLVVTNLQFGEQAYFTGTGTSNALYVDYLSFSPNVTLADVTNILGTDPNFTIYFADANLPAEQLDGLLGGHLRWVSSYAGPNSSVAVLINGKTVLVNKALRNSKDIDSNHNGIPNYYDPTPFDAPPLTLAASITPQASQSTPANLAISWLAAPNTVYQVEFATNIPATSWQPLMTYTNSASTNRMVTVWDTNAPASGPKRVYRVGYNP